MQQQAALMAAATAQGTAAYINPMAALASQIPHAATLNGMANPVVPPSSGEQFSPLISKLLFFYEFLREWCIINPNRLKLFITFLVAF